MKEIAILGSTGSIGTQALEVTPSGPFPCTGFGCAWKC